MQDQSPDGELVVYVGRPTVMGNPFDGSPAGLEAFSRLVQGIVLPDMHLLGDVSGWLERFRAVYGPGVPWQAVRPFLRGRHLACWCPNSQPCHADIWLKLVNHP